MLCGAFFSVTFAQSGVTHKSGIQAQIGERSYQNPIGVLNAVKYNANKHKIEEVQQTQLDNISSNCNDSIWWVSWRFTITKTICNIKSQMGSYLQYVIYIWLSLATILLIRNGFKLVTSKDKWNQMKEFGKNIVKIIIWVILLISFYYILDVFVSVINFVAE